MHGMARIASSDLLASECVPGRARSFGEGSPAARPSARRPCTMSLLPTGRRAVDRVGPGRKARPAHCARHRHRCSLELGRKPGPRLPAVRPLVHPRPRAGGGAGSGDDRLLETRRRPPRVAPPRRPRPLRSAGTSAITQPPNPPPVIRAPRAPAPDRGVGDQVDVLGGDLEVVTHGRVRGGEDPPGFGEVRITQRSNTIEHPLVLGEHVAGPAGVDRVASPADGGRPAVCDLAQRRRPEIGGRPLARRAARGIVAAGVTCGGRGSRSAAARHRRRPGRRPPARR